MDEAIAEIGRLYGTETKVVRGGRALGESNMSCGAHKRRPATALAPTHWACAREGEQAARRAAPAYLARRARSAESVTSRARSPDRPNPKPPPPTKRQAYKGLWPSIHKSIVHLDPKSAKVVRSVVVVVVSRRAARRIALAAAVPFPSFSSS